MTEQPDNQQPSLRDCKKCGETKPLEDFAIVYAKNSRGQNYRQHTCKVCFRIRHAANARKARAANPEKYRKISRKHWYKHHEKNRSYKREWNLQLKKTAFERYGLSCICCGETCLTMLNIDHINNDGAEHRKSIKGNMSGGINFYHWLKKNDYPDGYQTLCYNCNLSKYHNDGICEHQEGSTTIP